MPLEILMQCRKIAAVSQQKPPLIVKLS